MALVTFEFQSESLLRNVSVDAIIPFDNEGGKREPFKTLYLLHGLTGSKSDWVRHTRIYEIAQAHNLAVIMPSGENMFYMDHEPSGDKYGEFIGRELVEVTRFLFPLSAKREDTFIAGLSMGGFGAIRNGLKYSETFGALAGMSPALIMKWLDDPEWQKGRGKFHEWLIWGNPAQLAAHDKDPYALAKRVADNGPVPAIYLSCGTEDHLIEPLRELHGFLLQNGLAHEYVELPGLHDWDFWGEDIKRVVDWLPL